MKRSAIVLAGGFSRRFKQDKGLLVLGGKPLILHTINRISAVVDEVIVVVNSKNQEESYTNFLPSNVEVVVDKCETQSPLVGALTGFGSVGGQYSLLLPCDTPLISSEVVSLLLELCVNKDAVIPRWPNGYLEPLQAAYHVKSALAAATKALEDNKLNMYSMIACLKKVRYVSTSVFRQMDPKLLTFLNVNTPEDLRKADSMLQSAG